MNRWTIYFLTIGLSFLNLSLFGQTPQKRKNPFYFSWTAGAGELFFPKTKGQMQISFPYSSTDASGNTTNNIFTSQSINPYEKPKLMGSAINFEFGNVHNFIDVRIYAYMTSGNQVNFSLGYGYNVYLDFAKQKSTEMTERKFILKPSLNIGFSQYRNPTGHKTDNYFGSIDNVNKTLNFLGYTSPPTFSYTSGRPSKTYVQNVNEVDFLFAQNDWVIIPKISLSNNHYQNFFHWEINLAYYFPIYEKGGVQIFQNGWHPIKSPGVLGLAENGLVTTFNQTTISKSPYNFRGVFISATAGFNLSKKLIERLGARPKRFKPKL